MKRVLLVLTILPVLSAGYRLQPYSLWHYMAKYGEFYGPDNNLTIARSFIVPSREEMEALLNKPELDKSGEILDYMVPQPLDDNLKLEGNFFDYDDFKWIKEELQNVSNVSGRRQITSDSQFCSYGLCFSKNYDGQDGPNTLIFEKSKIRKGKNLVLAFLIHTRYKFKEAVTVRDLVWLDKRYKLGYLFNRLRRLAYDQRKLFDNLALSEASSFRRLVRNLHVFKILKRYTVDIRDCIRHIERIYFYVVDPLMITASRLRKFKTPKRTLMNG